VESGQVVFSARSGGYGHAVIVKHAGGKFSVYGNMDRRAVLPGHSVKKGDTLGYVGSPAPGIVPHLHFEIRRKDGPADPMRYLP
jgi:murein DD-endopeptidase MepM/ murein hydrolase activator NlpD